MHTDRKADQYEFVVENLNINSSSPTTNIFEGSIDIIIEWDDNADTVLNAESYFSMSKNITLNV